MPSGGRPGFQLLAYRQRGTKIASKDEAGSFAVDGRPAAAVPDPGRQEWTVLAWVPLEGEWSSPQVDDPVLQCSRAGCKRQRSPVTLGVLVRRARGAMGFRQQTIEV